MAIGAKHAGTNDEFFIQNTTGGIVDFGTRKPVTFGKPDEGGSMRRTIRRHGRIGALIVAAAMLAACSGSSSDDSSAPTEPTESSTTAPAPDTSVAAPTTDSTEAPAQPANGIGWTLSQRESAGSTTTELTGERCGTQIVDGTWTFTSVTTDPAIGRLVGNFTIDADDQGGGSFTLVMEIDSPMIASDEARASGVVNWDLRDDGSLEFNLFADGPSLTFTNGVQDSSASIDVSSEFDPILWQTGTC